jgi:hypothetical protein
MSHLLMHWLWKRIEHLKRFKPTKHNDTFAHIVYKFENLVSILAVLSLKHNIV